MCRWRCVLYASHRLFCVHVATRGQDRLASMATADRPSPRPRVALRPSNGHSLARRSLRPADTAPRPMAPPWNTSAATLLASPTLRSARHTSLVVSGILRRTRPGCAGVGGPLILPLCDRGFSDGHPRGRAHLRSRPHHSLVDTDSPTGRLGPFCTRLRRSTTEGRRVIAGASTGSHPQ